MRSNKTIRITFRLTEEEAARLDSDMRFHGYKSMSKYIRRHIFHGRPMRRNYKSIDSDVTKPMELLIGEVKRIGINYNQAVKSINTFAGIRDAKGNSVITSNTIDGILTDMRKLMQEILKRMDECFRQIST